MAITTIKLRRAALRAAMVLAVVAAFASRGAAQQADTLCVYRSWQSIFNQRADTVVIGPKIEVRSPYDYDFSTASKGVTRAIRQQSVAVAIGDSTWLISSNWIKANFKGDCSHFARFVPLYFSAKVAFVQWLRNGPTFGGVMLNMMVGLVSGIDTGVGMGGMYNGDTAPFYHLDFATHTVHKVDSDYLISLLGAYPDLLRRYTMMNNYQSTPMVNSYFMEYVDRLNSDPSVPYLF